MEVPSYHIRSWLHGYILYTMLSFYAGSFYPPMLCVWEPCLPTLIRPTGTKETKNTCTWTMHESKNTCAVVFYFCCIPFLWGITYVVLHLPAATHCPLLITPLCLSVWLHLQNIWYNNKGRC